MRKAALILFLAGMLGNELAAQQITVTSPDGTPWCNQDLNSHMITWTASGSMQPTVTIALRMVGSAAGSEPALYIAQGTPNDGSYHWTIPASVAPGDYYLRVRTDDATVIGDSVTFRIQACPASISVTSPFGAEWKAGTPHAITWTKSGAMQNAVTIALRAAGSAPDAGPALVIASGEANDGFYSWAIPASVAPGNYFIRVRTDDAAVIGDSVVFPISGQSAAAITVLYPVNPVVWHLGSTQTIRWSSSGSTGDQVRIELKDPAMTHTASLIASSAQNSGSYSWHIPDDFVEDNYRIRVCSLSDPSVFGDSAVVGISFFSCGYFDSLSKASGYPGDSFTMSGKWPVRQGSRCPRMFSGPDMNYMLEVLSWSTEAIQARVPAVILPGPYRVNIRCQCDNPIVSSEAKDFMVLAHPADFLVRIVEYADGRLKVKVVNQGNAYYCPFDIKLTVRDLDHAKATIFPATLFKEHEEKTFSLLFPAWPRGKDCLECQVMFDSMARIPETNELNNTATQSVCRSSGN